MYPHAETKVDAARWHTAHTQGNKLASCSTYLRVRERRGVERRLVNDFSRSSERVRVLLCVGEADQEHVRPAYLPMRGTTKIEKT